MRTFKVNHQNGDTSYGVVVRKTPVAVILELEDKKNYVFSNDGYLIHNEGETDFMMIEREDLSSIKSLVV